MPTEPVAHGAHGASAAPIPTVLDRLLEIGELFHGTVGMFERAGFTEVARPTRDRAIMQLRLRD
jgi:hypothetical protein